MSSATRWNIQIEREAERALARLNDPDQTRVVKAIATMAENPLGGDIKKLQGGSRHYRRRAGNFRILFRLDRDIRTVIITRIADRKEAYD